jgi:hypothetical protein
MSFARSTSPARLKARTRAALGQLMEEVLAAPLGALETRLSQRGWLGERRGSAEGGRGRLLEVLDRDRALRAAEPVSPAAPVEPSVPAPAVAVPAVSMPEPAQAVDCEPIRTRTMARLLAAQGYRARALAIYQALLAENPSDTELHAERERLQAQSA